ncbi:MAG: metabolite traffic protein EboE [Planctomycetota bacterium]
MDNFSPPRITMLGYCTNVHPGTTLAEVRANLEWHALAVKRRFSPDKPMGIGLWLAADAASELVSQPEALADFKAWLDDAGLRVFTFNGFPFGPFHGDVVKEAVYQPDWSTAERYDYTLDLARLLAHLLPDDAEGSISTLPLGWPAAFGDTQAAFNERLQAAGNRLTDLVHQLARLELDTGKCIHVDLEPEPGCILEHSAGVVQFFKDQLLGTVDDVSVLGYLRVCHDVCHAAVMFEDQHLALANYRAAGIQVGKVQVSSAVEADWALSDAEAVRAGLDAFAEPRYLHQTSVKRPGGDMVRYLDLPDALRDEQTNGLWRTHFHVPVYAESLGALGTTRGEIDRCFSAIQPDDGVQHFEVETYAWGVLPEEHRVEELGEGIAKELVWTAERLRAAGLKQAMGAGAG